MLKFIAALVGLALLVVVIRSFADDDAVPADPVSGSANLDLRMRAQSGIQVTVASLANRMKQVMAAGNEPTQRTALDADLAALHVDLDAACTQLTTLGDSPAAVEQWLVRIGWPEFQRTEAEYHKAGGR